MGARTALLSGGAGFVGRHLLELLRSEEWDVVAPPKEELDFRDRAAVDRLVADSVPDAVFHLAALSSPAVSWERPADAVLGNVEMTVNLLEAVRAHAPQAAVVLAGSGQVYGELDALPATEDMPLRPNSPYAVSKATADMLGAQYAEGFGMRLLRMRPFNHSGPGQSEEYVLSSIARQIAAAEVEGRDACEVRTGNPHAARDFTDVRDVVRAYVLSVDIDPAAYNVCRGAATSVAELVEVASGLTELPVRHEFDRSLARANETQIIYGSADRLTAACGWRPQISLERTLRDTIDWWRERLGARPARG